MTVAFAHAGLSQVLGGSCENLETTHVYVEADLTMKENALEKLAPLGQHPRRFKADDKLMRFLDGL